LGELDEKSKRRKMAKVDEGEDNAGVDDDGNGTRRKRRRVSNGDQAVRVSKGKRKQLAGLTSMWTSTQ